MGFGMRGSFLTASLCTHTFFPCSLAIRICECRIDVGGGDSSSSGSDDVFCLLQPTYSLTDKAVRIKAPNSHQVIHQMEPVHARAIHLIGKSTPHSCTLTEIERSKKRDDGNDDVIFKFDWLRHSCEQERIWKLSGMFYLKTRKRCLFPRRRRRKTRIFLASNTKCAKVHFSLFSFANKWHRAYKWFDKNSHSLLLLYLYRHWRAKCHSDVYASLSHIFDTVCVQNSNM